MGACRASTANAGGDGTDDLPGPNTVSERLGHKSSLLMGAMAIAVVVAFARSHQDGGSVAGLGAPSMTAIASPETGPPDVESSVAGRIAERLDVPPYSYLHLEQANGSRLWVAVPATSLGVGEEVSVTEPHLMLDFTSSTLGRTFDRIYFGALAQEPGSQGDGADPGLSPAEQGHIGAPPSSAERMDPHRHPGAGGEPLNHSVPRAEGPKGRTIAELHAQRDALAGDTVRVRGVVTRAVAGVLGRTFVHLRDGSGDERQGTHDLTLTTTEVPSPGQTLLFEGRLELDRDFGSGYRYPVILEDARSTAGPPLPGDAVGVTRAGEHPARSP